MRMTRLGGLGGWPRRVLALGCVALAAASAVSAARTGASSRVPVAVASRAIAAGALVTPADVSIAQWPRDIRPPSAFGTSAAVVGQRSAGGIAAGEALTPSRLITSALTKGLAPGLSAVPVALADTGSAALIRIGDYVDLIAAAEGAAAPSALARQVLVLAVVAAATSGGLNQPAELVVAADETTSLRLAAFAGRGAFATVRAPP